MNMKKIFFTTIALASLTILASCQKEINLGNTVNEGQYQTALTPTIGIRNEAGKAYTTVVELRKFNQASEVKFNLASTVTAKERIISSVEVGDTAMISNYNKVNGTDFKAFPTDNPAYFELKDAEDMEIAKGDKICEDQFSVSVTIDGTFDKDAVYMIPLVVKTNKNALSGEPHYIFVKNLQHLQMDNTKYLKGTNQTMTIFNCMEINHTNALFSLSFKLKNTQQYIIDATVLFDSGGTVKFNEETGEIMHDPVTGTIAQCRRFETIIKVMHEHGCRVIIPTLGNGFCQFDGKTCKEYARTLANFCKAYNIDGIFIDTEYTALDTSRPGITSASGSNGARLCYEFKKLCPDKWVVNYLYSTASGISSSTVDGHKAEEFVDFNLNDYGRTSVPSGWTNGNAHTGIYSDNASDSFASMYTNSTSRAQSVLSGKYGAHMIYCLEEHTYNEGTKSSQIQQAFKNWASIWFGDEFQYDYYENKVEW